MILGTTTTLAFDVQTEGISPLIDGIFDGCAFGLLALGIVLLYKSDRILNFAQGEFAGVSLIVTYIFDQGYKGSFLFIPLDIPKVWYPVAVIFGVSASVLTGVLTQLIVIRPLFSRPRVTLVVATIGVTLFLIGVEGFVYPKTGSTLRQINQVVSLGAPHRVDQIPLEWGDLLRGVVLVVLGVGAFLFFRYTRTGTAILAVSQDATAASIVGIKPQRVSLITWGMAGLLGGFAGVVPISSYPVQPAIFTGFLLVPGFVAAVLGGITSLPGAFVGGILLGLVESFANTLGSNNHFLENNIPSDFQDVAIFAVLVIVLLVRPAGLLGKAA